MVFESQLDMISSILIFFAAIVPTYLGLKLQGVMRNLSVALAAFIVLHGIYHLLRIQGMESMADGVFEPASVVMLIGFGTIYLGVSYKNKQETRRK